MIALLHRQPPSARLALAFALLIVGAVVLAVLTLFHTAPPQVVRVASIEDLQEVFATLDYSLAGARRAGQVPRLTITAIPDGWQAGLDIDVRKRVFFESVLPLVLIANERIDHDRRRLEAIATRLRRGDMLSAANRRWLAALAHRYRVAWPAVATAAQTSDVLAILRERVAPVPPSLVLAQAAVESAYGTSRFAVTGNALFGQWTRGDGLTPQAQRASKAEWTVAAFASPLRSVEAYLRNLNTHRAYGEFRQARLPMVDGSAILSGAALASTLAAYSEKGAAYTETLREIIHVNDLAALDRAALDAGRRVLLVVL